MVQEGTRRKKAGEEQQRYVPAARRWVTACFVDDPEDVRDWPVMAPLGPHVRVVASEADVKGIAEPTGLLMNRLGVLLHSQARWKEAEPLNRRALAIGEK